MKDTQTVIVRGEIAPGRRIEPIGVAVGEVLDQPTLADLRESLMRELAGIELSARRGLEHAIKAGKLLLAMQELAPAGEWIAWSKANVPLDYSVIAQYMRVAEHEDKYAGVLPSTAPISDVVRFLADAGLSRSGGFDQLPPGTREQIRDLRAEGLSITAIVERTGIRSRHTVWRIACPDAFERSKRRKREQWQRNRDAQEALDRQERDRVVKDAVRKAGAALGEAYARAESMDAVIAQAHREATDREARAALSLAGMHYRKMRDQIVRALGIAA